MPEPRCTCAWTSQGLTPGGGRCPLHGSAAHDDPTANVDRYRRPICNRLGRGHNFGSAFCDACAVTQMPEPRWKAEDLPIENPVPNESWCHTLRSHAMQPPTQTINYVFRYFDEAMWLGAMCQECGYWYWRQIAWADR